MTILSPLKKTIFNYFSWMIAAIRPNPVSVHPAEIRLILVCSGLKCYKIIWISTRFQLDEQLTAGWNADNQMVESQIKFGCMDFSKRMSTSWNSLVSAGWKKRYIQPAEIRFIYRLFGRISDGWNAIKWSEYQPYFSRMIAAESQSSELSSS